MEPFDLLRILVRELDRLRLNYTGIIAIKVHTIWRVMTAGAHLGPRSAMYRLT